MFVMSHGNKAEGVEDAVEGVAEALEKIEGSDSKPPPSKKYEKMKAWGSLMTHGVALIAAAGAFFKSCDHSLTENAYETLSVSISKVQEQQQHTSEDVVALRAYLDGLSRAPVESIPSPSPTLMPMDVMKVVDAGPPPVLRPILRPLPRPVSPAPPTTSAAKLDVAPMTPTMAALMAQDAPPVPTVHATPAPAPPPPFAAVEAKAAQ